MKWEINLIKFIQDIACNFFDIIFQLITILGEQYVLILILVLIYFMYDKEMGEKIAYSIFISLCLNNAIKGIVCRLRPFQIDDDIRVVRKETATGYSFPSGHTQNASVTYISCSINMKKKYITIISIVIISLVALSRVYLGVHFPTDVLIGAVLGILCSYLGYFLYNKFATSYKSKLCLLFISNFVFFPFLFLFYRNTFSEILIFKDFYVAFSLFLGYNCAIAIENKFVKFKCSSSFKTNLFRTLGCLIILIITMFGLKIILPKEIIYCDMLRYFLVSFLALGIYPLLFKIVPFLKEKQVQ